MKKINVWALGMALGIVWGAAMLLLGWAAALFNWGTMLVQVMSSLYIGFIPSFWGSILGGIWGFFDAGIAGILIAWIYNSFVK